MMQVSSLHLYPVKSCRGIATLEMEVDGLGPADDRRFLIVNADGKFMTQRERPEMARILVRPGTDGWILLAPDQGEISVPLRSPDGAPVRSVTIWRDTVLGEDCGDEAASRLSGFFGEPVRLVRVGRDYSRPIPADRTPVAFGGIATPPQVAFGDAFPFLVTSIASMNELNSRLSEPLPMDRFRPNIVVTGCAPFEEDTWLSIRIGGVLLHAAGPCGRCIITTTDQHTGERGKEPLRTLATYRRGPDGAVNFGQNFIHAPERGTIRVGDFVVVLERRPPA